MRRLSLPPGRFPPIIFFVILPAISITISTVIFLLTVPAHDVTIDRGFTVLTPAYITLLLSFIYAVKRPHSIQEYLKQGLEQAIIEFETVRKVMPLIILIAVSLITFSIWVTHIFSGTWGALYTSSVFGLILYIGIAGLLMYGLVISKKEFRFYFARTCFMSALNKEDIFEQMYYFSLGLQTYNKYLKRHLKHQIKDIDKVFSKVSLLDKDVKNKIIHTLSNSFETETDKLKPLKCISSEPMKSEDVENVLIPESLKSQLKVVGAFLTASIPIAVSTISLLLTNKIIKLPG